MKIETILSFLEDQYAVFICYIVYYLKTAICDFLKFKFNATHPHTRRRHISEKCNDTRAGYPGKLVYHKDLHVTAKLAPGQSLHEIQVKTLVSNERKMATWFRKYMALTKYM